VAPSASLDIHQYRHTLYIVCHLSHVVCLYAALRLLCVSRSGWPLFSLYYWPYNKPPAFLTAFVPQITFYWVGRVALVDTRMTWIDVCRCLFSLICDIHYSELRTVPLFHVSSSLYSCILSVFLSPSLLPSITPRNYGPVVRFANGASGCNITKPAKCIIRSLRRRILARVLSYIRTQKSDKPLSCCMKGIAQSTAARVMSIVVSPVDPGRGLSRPVAGAMRCNNSALAFCYQSASLYVECFTPYSVSAFYHSTFNTQFQNSSLCRACVLLLRLQYSYIQQTNGQAQAVGDKKARRGQ
jgi:hypothetical protein